MFSIILRFVTLFSALSGILLIFYVNLSVMRYGDVLSTVGNLLSFFTVQSNILVFVVMIGLVLGFWKSLKSHAFFHVVLVNILITGLVYFFVLENVWEPEGFVKIADQLLHYSTPILFFVYYFVGLVRKKISYRVVFLVLIYPVVFFVYSLVRGSFTDFYPYFFIDPFVYSYSQIFVNASMVLFLFVGVSAVLVFLHNLVYQKFFKGQVR